MSSSKPLAATGSPVRILCLDGGGVRGLSSLLILEEIMEKIKESEHLSEVPKPCDKFGFIGGTGTGGIIAIMLGRLRMGINQSIEAYKHLASTAFVAESTPTTSPRAFSATKLEIAIKQMVRTNCGDPQCLLQWKSGGSATDAETCQHEDMLFLDEHCTKTAVLAMTKVNLETLPTLLTTYDTCERFMGCKVWEVARATSAAVTSFDSIKLGRDDIEFIDASYGYNNPCQVLIREAKKQFPDEEMIILSIGAGLGDVVEIKDSESSVLKALSTIATSSKRTDLELRETYKRTEVYHRFDVQNGLKDTSDWHEFSKISAHTMNYLNENNEAVMQFITAFTAGGVSQPTIYHDEKDKECLRDLYVTDPRTDKKNIEERKGGLMKDCYRWIVKHKDFEQFLQEEESRILWIKGHPGKGKTMLLCGIINELELQRPVPPLSYFFCQAANDQVNTAASVLRGLIYDLANQNPQLTKHVRKKYDVAGNKLFSNSSLWNDLCDILTNMLNDPSLRNAILIVDALDECSKSRQKLLEFISKPSPAKWIVSSRNWPEIEEVLSDADQKVTIHLETNQDSVSAAVDSYIKWGVDRLVKRKKYDNDTKMVMLKYLKKNSSSTFLWVALVLQELSNPKAKKWHILDILRTLPPGLDQLYQRMLVNISESRDAQLCKDIVALALVVYQPITLEELQVLVKSLEDMETEEVKEIIGSCGCFLTVHKNTVSFVHQSAKDYFLKNASSEILPYGIPHEHHRVLLRSLDILHEKLRRNIYRLQTPGCLIGEISVPKPDPLAAIGYSCIFWVDHLCDSAANDMAKINEGILALFKDKYLRWLEALSLLRSLYSAGRALEKLRPFLEKSSQDLQEIAKDAQRFLLSYGGVIEIAPLQVYVSALLFSPTNSLIRQLNSHDEPDWIELKPRVEENWDVCLRTLEGHHSNVTSVAFSNDGQRLASGSEDKTVKIWDATSGACLQTLEGHHGSVTSVVFSNDGQRLASGSFDNTVKIWDTTSGALLHTLQSYDELVTSVVFSHDGQRLASGSYDATVRIWNATSGACLQILEGHDDSVTSVVFSSDRKRLASGSWDKTIKIWNATSGACLLTLEGHRRHVTSVVFSNNGQRLASGSKDPTVKIWDATSGVCLQTLESHHSAVTSVVFSNNGQQLASGSWDKTVKIWDATSGALLQTLEGHHREVASVVFSNDGQRLASGSFDKTVKIWDATSSACLQPLESHDDWATSVVFSNDGQRLASGSNDFTVKIWDATSGACLQTLEGHHREVTSVVFSINGQRLASGSWDKTVKIWDATSGACLQTLEGHLREVTSVVFSNDGQRLASGSKDPIVNIWDATSGACLQTLQGHHGSVTSVVFSNDGQQLASGSWDKTVKIWDATSGVCMRTLEGHDREVTSAAFSSDGQRLASGSYDSTVKIWDATSGACLRTLEGHNDSCVTSVVFANDGQRLASGSWDKTVKIWDTTSGACLQTFEGYDPTVTSVVFSKNTQRLASKSLADQTSPIYSEFHSFSISYNGVWVMIDREAVLWLPPAYRSSTFAVSLNTFAVGLPSGRVILIRFTSTSRLK